MGDKRWSLGQAIGERLQEKVEAARHSDPVERERILNYVNNVLDEIERIHKKTKLKRIK